MREKGEGLVDGHQALGTQQAVLPQGQRFLQRTPHIVGLIRLLQDLEHASGIDGLDEQILVGIRGDEDGGDIAVFGIDEAQQLRAVTAGHAEIGQDDADALVRVAQHGLRLVDAVGREHVVAHADGASKPLAGLHLVVDVEDGDGIGRGVHGAAYSARGRSNVKRAHSPSWLVTASVPPWRWITL